MDNFVIRDRVKFLTICEVSRMCEEATRRNLPSSMRISVARLTPHARETSLTVNNFLSSGKIIGNSPLGLLT